MHPIRKLCRLACLAGLLLGLTLCLSGPTFAQKGEGKGKGKGKAQAEVVEVDLSKLPPGLAQQIRDALKAPEPKAKEKGKKDDGKKDKKDKDAKKKAKDISLTDAIRIAETVGKGECVKAERKSKDGQTEFKLEVLTRDGSKERLTLDPRGNVLQQDQKGGKKKDDGKKGKK
jgi:hypothetical protein